MYTTVEDAQQALEDSINDVLADMGGEGEVGRDDVAFELISSIGAYECTAEVAVEFCRRELAYVPQSVARAHGIPATDFLDDWV